MTRPGLLLVLLVAPALALDVQVSAHADRVAAHDVFELSFLHENGYAAPFFEATVVVRLTSPRGKGCEVGGFFFGSSEKPRIRVEG